MIQTPNPNPNPLTHNPISLSDSDKEFITRLAKRIQRSGFVTPAIFFLEMTKPLYRYRCMSASNDQIRS